MKIYFTLFFLLFCFFISLPLNGQYITVNFDYELATFNDNQPLPSETNTIISGSIPNDIQLVEINIFKASGNNLREPLFTGFWKRPYNKPEGDFRVPINFKLRESKKYDFEINYFVEIDETERSDLFDKLTGGLHAYIDQTIQISNKKMELRVSPGEAVADMNDLVWNGIQNYRSKTENYFPGFSDVVREQISNIKKSNLKPLKTDSLKNQRANEFISSLKKLVTSEVQYLLNDPLVKRTDRRYVDDYETEKKPGYFAINAGYGAVYLGGNVENLDYGTAPYLSIGFPFSTSRIAPSFIRNSSLTFGIFLRDFEIDDNTTITGPVIKRPIQVGLDYKLFQFIRFNAGIALLEENKVNVNGGEDQRIFIQPFVGLSAKFNLRLSLDK